MLVKHKRVAARLLSAAVIILVVCPGAWGDQADQVLDRIVENWRWSNYWFGKTGIDDVYVVGKQVSALVFWNRNEIQPIRGLCSTELSLCVAYAGVYLDPGERRMRMAANVDAQQAFTSFVSSGFHDSAHLVSLQGFSTADFQVERKSFTLPVLNPPLSVMQKAVPEWALREAKRIEPRLACWGTRFEKRPRGCSGTVVFAYYGSNDPYWFVLRSCSTACEFKGESVEMLTRGDYGWEATSGGFIGSPKEEVERLKQQIEKAEMFRFPIK